MKIVHILPRVPPAICGIGDYSWRLAQALRDQHDIHSSFLSAGTNWTKPQGETEFPVFRLSALKAGELSAWISAHRKDFDAVVLHMSPYGYQKRAVPVWLARGWRRIALQPDRPGLITMFHELYASGPVTSSAFWLQPLQKMILRQVANLSDGLRTNREAYAAWLGSITLSSRTTIMPVFSNFGELDHPPQLAERPSAMISFSSGIHAGGGVMKSIQSSVALCKLFNLDTLHLIGGPNPGIETADGVRLLHQAFLPADESSRLLVNCRLAYVGYHPAYLGKSTIFAGFAAHGLVVATRGEQPALPDGLREHREVLHLKGLFAGAVPEPDELQRIAGNLFKWYQGHNLAKNAESYAGQINSIISRRHA